MLSIIIVTHNSEKFIRKCLDSIKGKHEIIIIDNNSKDNTPDILNDYEIKLLKNRKNLGYARAVNQGIRIAKGEFLLILNPDIVLDRNTISALLDYLKKNKDVGIVGCKLTNNDQTLQYSCRRFPKISGLLSNYLGFETKSVKGYLMLDYDHKTIRQVDWISGSMMMMRRITKFDERFFMYFEDVDICRRVGKKYKVMYYPIVKATHIAGYASKKNPVMFLHHMNSMIRYFTKRH